VPAWGTTRAFNHNVHHARLSDVTFTQQNLVLELDVSVFGDARGNPPGYARYRVELARATDADDSGKYTGEFGGKSYRFAAVPEDKDKGFWHHKNYDGGKKLIDITKVVGREYFSTNFFYSVTRNDKVRCVRFDAGLYDSAILYLNGVCLAHNEVARIEPGLYPMLVQAYIDQINPWGRQMMRPRLVAAGRAKRGRAVANWQQRRQEWEDLGGIDLESRDLFERSRHMMYLFCREAVGNGGFQAELAHYSAIVEKGPARYMGAHLQMLGYHVSPQQNMEQLLPRKMFVHVYPDEGEPRALEINGSALCGHGGLVLRIERARDGTV
jgi:hypothetical protein